MFLIPSLHARFKSPRLVLKGKEGWREGGKVGGKEGRLAVYFARTEVDGERRTREEEVKERECEGRGGTRGRKGREVTGKGKEIKKERE